jgi:hypothetical protein
VAFTAGASAVVLPSAVVLSGAVVFVAGGVVAVTDAQSVPRLVPVESKPVRPSGAAPQMAVLPLRLLLRNKMMEHENTGSCGQPPALTKFTLLTPATQECRCQLLGTAPQHTQAPSLCMGQSSKLLLAPLLSPSMHPHSSTAPPALAS